MTETSIGDTPPTIAVAAEHPPTRAEGTFTVPAVTRDQPDGTHRGGAFATLRGLLRSRTGLLILGGSVVAVGLAFNWSWLAAAGVTPILLALAPCAVMCALGLCMSRMGKRSTAVSSTVHNDALAAPDPQAIAQARSGDCCSPSHDATSR